MFQCCLSSIHSDINRINFFCHLDFSELNTLLLFFIFSLAVVIITFFCLMLFHCWVTDCVDAVLQYHWWLLFGSVLLLGSAHKRCSTLGYILKFEPVSMKLVFGLLLHFCNVIVPAWLFWGIMLMLTSLALLFAVVLVPKYGQLWCMLHVQLHFSQRYIH